MATKKNNEGTAEKTVPTKTTKLQAPEGFELVDWKWGRRVQAGRYGTIDLATLTPEGAARLVRRGFKYIRLKK